MMIPTWLYPTTVRVSVHKEIWENVGITWASLNRVGTLWASISRVGTIWASLSEIEITWDQSMPGRNNLGQSVPGRNHLGQSKPGRNHLDQYKPSRNPFGQSKPGRNYLGQSRLVIDRAMCGAGTVVPSNRKVYGYVWNWRKGIFWDACLRRANVNDALDIIALSFSRKG